MKAKIIQLEEKRRNLQQKKNRMGSLYDYLDRGKPDSGQKITAWEEIKSLEREIKKLQRELDTLVVKIKEEDEDTYCTWIELHLATCDKIITSTENIHDGSFESVRNSVAQDIKKNWQDLRESTTFTIDITGSFINDYDTILDRIISDLKLQRQH